MGRLARAHGYYVRWMHNDTFEWPRKIEERWKNFVGNQNSHMGPKNKPSIDSGLYTYAPGLYNVHTSRARVGVHGPYASMKQKGVFEHLDKLSSTRSPHLDKARLKNHRHARQAPNNGCSSQANNSQHTRAIHTDMPLHHSKRRAHTTLR